MKLKNSGIRRWLIFWVFAALFVLVIGLIQGVSAAGNVGPLHAYITGLYDWAIGICASLAVLMIMYGGYRYMASQSEPSAITEAKEIVVSALSGLILLGLVWLIKDAIGV